MSLRSTRSVLLSMAVLLFATMGFAWNCPTGQIRQQAPAGTPTSAPFYDVVEGIAFICVPSTPPTPPPSTPSTQTQNQTQQQSQNQQQNATATSTSTSGASATGGNSTSSATGGTSNATGGKVSNSGNSSNTNTNVAQGGRGGKGGKGGNASQTQSSTSSATGNGVGNGNNSNDYQSSTLVEASKIPVSTAFAPSQFPTVGCYKTYSAGAQSQAFGVSLGGGKIDENCAILEAAGRARNILAYCKVYITDKYVHKAGVTLEDCMHQEQIAVPLPPPIVAAPVPQPTVIVVPAAPVPVAPVPAVALIGVCDKVTNECKAWLDGAVNWKKQNEGRVVIYGSLTTYQTANAMRLYLKHAGLTDEDVLVQMSDKNISTSGVGFGYEQ